VHKQILQHSHLVALAANSSLSASRSFRRLLALIAEHCLSLSLLFRAGIRPDARIIASTRKQNLDAGQEIVEFSPPRKQQMKTPPTAAEKIFNILSHCEYFGGLSQEALKRLAGASHLREYAKRERLFTENRAGGLVFVLVRGAIQLTKTGRQGSEVVIRTVRPFEIFAEAVLFEADGYPVTATAAAPAAVIAIDRRDFLRLLEDGAFRTEYLRAMASRMRYLAERVRNLASYDVEQRFFMFLSEHYGRRPEIRAELSKKDMAAAIGAVPETFSRMVRRLQRRRLVRWEGRRISVSQAAWDSIGKDE